MSYHAVSLGANVITHFKNGDFKAMTCAWVTMVDYDKLVLLIGSQSDTGKAIQKGDIIGVSALSAHQQEIAEKIGSSHSREVDKKALADFVRFNSVWVVENAKTINECEVLEIYHLPGIVEDKLIFVRIIAHDEREELGFYRYP